MSQAALTIALDAPILQRNQPRPQATKIANHKNGDSGHSSYMTELRQLRYHGDMSRLTTTSNTFRAYVNALAQAFLDRDDALISALGERVDLADDKGALVLAAAIQTHYWSHVEAMLKLHPHTNAENGRALSLALLNNRADLVEYFLPQLKVDSPGAYHALWIAARSSEIETIVQLMPYFDHADRRIAMITAAEQNRTENWRYLKKTLDHVTPKGATASQRFAEAADNQNRRMELIWTCFTHGHCADMEALIAEGPLNIAALVDRLKALDADFWKPLGSSSFFTPSITQVTHTLPSLLDHIPLAMAETIGASIVHNQGKEQMDSLAGMAPPAWQRAWLRTCGEVALPETLRAMQSCERLEAIICINPIPGRARPRA